MKVSLATALALISLAGPSSGLVAQTSNDPLTIKVPGRIAPEPGEVLVRTRVERDARSRELTIGWWTEEGYGGSHMISLEGDRAAIWHHYSIKQMEAGEYEVSAVLKRNDGTQVKRTARVIIVGDRGLRDLQSQSSAASR